MSMVFVAMLLKASEGLTGNDTRGAACSHCLLQELIASPFKGKADIERILDTLAKEYAQSPQSNCRSVMYSRVLRSEMHAKFPTVTQVS